MRQLPYLFVRSVYIVCCRHLQDTTNVYFSSNNFNSLSTENYQSSAATTWTHQICRDTGVTATEALQLAEDRPFWRTITTAGGSG